MRMGDPNLKPAADRRLRNAVHFVHVVHGVTGRVTRRSWREVMHHMRRAFQLLTLIVLCAACGDNRDLVSPVDGDVQGSWTQALSGLSPGFEFIMALVDSSGVVRGTGSFAGEAGPFGTLAVSGTVKNDSLRLQIIYTLSPTFMSLRADTAQFTGVLSTRDRIDGTRTKDGVSEPIEFIRAKVGDPPS